MSLAELVWAGYSCETLRWKLFTQQTKLVGHQGLRGAGGPTSSLGTRSLGAGWTKSSPGRSSALNCCVLPVLPEQPNPFSILLQRRNTSQHWLMRLQGGYKLTLCNSAALWNSVHISNIVTLCYTVVLLCYGNAVTPVMPVMPSWFFRSWGHFTLQHFCNTTTLPLQPSLYVLLIFQSSAFRFIPKSSSAGNVLMIPQSTFDESTVASCVNWQPLIWKAPWFYNNLNVSLKYFH